MATRNVFTQTVRFELTLIGFVFNFLHCYMFSVCFIVKCFQFAKLLNVLNCPHVCVFLICYIVECFHLPTCCVFTLLYFCIFFSLLLVFSLCDIVVNFSVCYLYFHFATLLYVFSLLLVFSLCYIDVHEIKESYVRGGYKVSLE